MRIRLELAVLVAASAFAQAGPLSARDVVQKCQLAYDSVHSLNADVVGTLESSVGTAKISFQRPGFLRVTGKSIFGAPYDLIANRRGTWILNAGTWSEAKSAELGIATIMGVSMNAGSTLPAVLLHTHFNPLETLLTEPLSLTSETLSGRATFKVSAKKPLAIDLWIDSSTFFLVKSQTSIVGKTVTVEFKPPLVNRAIPLKTFLKL